MRCMALSILLRPEFTMATMAVLSHMQHTVDPLHWLPHTAVPSTTGNNSLTVMCIPCQLCGNSSWNHSPSEVKAPHPQDPEASVVSTTWGSSCHRTGPGRKQFHHCRSERNPAFKRTRWCNSHTPLDSSTIRLRKDRPCLITQQACWSCPIMDNNSLFVQHFLPPQALISLWRRSNLPWGRHMVREMVSNSMPQNTSLVQGPSVLLGLTGTHRY